MSTYKQLKTYAKEHGISVKDTVALSTQNDPFYAGSKANSQKAEWFAKLWRDFHFTDGIHLRRIHYRLISQDPPFQRPDGKPYENTNNDWCLLGTASRQARYLGLVSPESFIDRRNPEGHFFFDGTKSEDVTQFEIDSVYWSIPSWNLRLADDDFDFDPPTGSVSGYDYSDGDQEYHLEIWCEKSTMNDILLPLGEKYHVNVITSVGYQSITRIIGMCKRVAQIRKPTRIFYISDFDPRGDSMPVAVARQVEFWLMQYADDADIKLQPLMLTEDQVVEFQLPRTPIKPSEKMKKTWEENHNEGATELDALEALHPGVFQNIIENAIAPYIDDDLVDKLQDAEDSAQDDLDEAIENIWEGYKEPIDKLADEVKEISARFNQELEPIKERYKTEMAPLDEKLESYSQAINSALEEIYIDLPGRPGPDLNEPDEDDYLFSSDRKYGEQLNFYKRKQGKA